MNERGGVFDESCELLAAAVLCLGAPVARDRRRRLQAAADALPDGLPSAMYALANAAREYCAAHETTAAAPSFPGHFITRAAETPACPHYGWQDRADLDA